MTCLHRSPEIHLIPDWESPEGIHIVLCREYSKVLEIGLDHGSSEVLMASLSPLCETIY
jgi:hypothetical protein